MLAAATHLLGRPCRLRLGAFFAPLLPPMASCSRFDLRPGRLRAGFSSLEAAVPADVEPAPPTSSRFLPAASAFRSHRWRGVAAAHIAVARATPNSGTECRRKGVDPEHSGRPRPAAPAAQPPHKSSLLTPAHRPWPRPFNAPPAPSPTPATPSTGPATGQ